MSPGARRPRVIPLLLLAPALVAGCTLASAVGREPPLPGRTVVRDLRYHPSPLFADARSLDLFTPPGPGPHPVVIFVHGGYWHAGGRRADLGVYQRLGERFAARGVMAAVISYRLAPEHAHPAQLRDVARAVASVLANAAARGGDPRRVFLVGHSAGAHLAITVALDPRWLGAEGLSPRRLAGVVGISGPYDLPELATTATGERRVPSAFGSNIEVWEAASPARFDGAPALPLFLAAADDDHPILLRQGRALHQRLAARGAPVRWLEVPDRTHATVITELLAEEDPLGAAVLRFVEQHRAPLVRPR